MKQFTKYPKHYVKASAERDVAAMITDVINKRIASTGIGFIDGDTFAYAQDELVFTGSISKCIREAKKIAMEAPELLADPEELYSELFEDEDTIQSIYGLSKIVSLFRKHGAADTIPDWYFD